ncbi:MAG: hypothetical protein JST80_01790 [Bdellovibrionales bacterium]|nr:hypothetical protein [Bdellovibrionales bacterium]
MLKTIAAILISLPLYGLSPAQAAPLHPQALFKRCFAHVTGTVPSYEMTTRLQTRLAGISGEDAQRSNVINLCLEILNNTSIASNGSFTAPVSSTFFTSAEQSDLFVKTYLNFERLYASWFAKSLYVTRDDYRLTSYVLDREGPALYWNAATFIAGQKASSVVTTAQFYRPIRGAPNLTSSTSLAYFKTLYSSSRAQTDIGGIFVVSPTTTTYPGLDPNAIVRHVGPTVGLEAMASTSFQSLARRDPLSTYFSISSDGSSLTSYTNNSGNLVTGYLTGTAGGGVLGSAPYVMMNLSTYIGAQDGGLKVARDWSTSVMGDMLCKTTPALRYADGAGAVQSNFVNGVSPPFRGAASCMQCHANLDPLATSIRNLQISGITEISDNRKGGGGDQGLAGTAFTDFLAKWPTNQPAETGLVDKDTNFHLRPPSGKLYYRSFDGALVSVPIANGVADTGVAIAGTRDFYACMVSRYYKYFTGHEVNLMDPAISGLTLTSTQANEKNYVVTTSDNFKAGTQNIKALWSTMFNSAWYQDATFQGAQ